MRGRGWWLGVAAWFAAGLAQAVPAHYVVFEQEATGHVRPVYYRQVEVAKADWSTAAPRAPDDVAYRLWRDGVEQGVRRVAARSLRAEFARDPARGDDRIESRRVGPAPRHFVVRVALAEGDAIEFGDGPSAQRFDLAGVAAHARSLARASVAPVQVQRAAGAGDPGNRVDVLVLAEGYTAAQRTQFDLDVATLRDSFFGLTPYREYGSFVNWTTGFVASNESGADHPPYQAGCTQSTCCSDADAQGDPRAGQFVDTAFDSTFCYYQIQRLLYLDAAAAFAAASAYPDWDELVVVVNDPVYGGAGGPLSTTSVHPQAKQIVLHEYGHSFSGLADEYFYPDPAPPGCSDVSGGLPCEANVTDRTSASEVKWRSWFTPGNPIPTPAGTSGVGLFEGASYVPSGLFRPVDTMCLMNYLNKPFCPVCAQEYVRVLYRGGFGSPAGGIDLIEPGSETPAATVPVAYAAGTDLAFGVSLLQPTIGALDVQWYLDGGPIAGATGTTHVFSQAAATPAVRTLEVRVKDLTPLVSASMAGGLLEHRRAWTLRVFGDAIFEDGFDGP